MKRSNKNSIFAGKHLTKVPWSVRLAIVILFVGIQQIDAVSSYSQETRLSLDVEAKSLTDVFTLIEKDSEFLFNYLDADVAGIKVDVNVKNGNIRDVLGQALRNTNLIYSIDDRHVTIMKAKETTSSNLTLGAQQDPDNKTTISGVVTDKEGEPLIGVAVMEKGTSNGVITDINGNYSISLKSTAVLLFQYLGYETQEVPVNGRTLINILLEEDNKVLDEVVVVGYRAQTKASLTGSVTTVNMVNKETETITNASQAMYSAAGVWVNQGSAQPGLDKTTIRIRGVNTLNNANPLILLDGIEYAIDEIDPNDIESISVLKDASASIYGSKATNGVILITSKTGKKGKAKIEYKGHFGIQQATYLPDVVSDPIMYMKMRNIAEVNSGKDPGAVTYTWDMIREYEQGMGVDPSIYPSSDWYDITLTNGFIQQHNIRVSGGTDAVTYTMGVGYMNQEGVLIANDNANRYSFDMKLTAAVTPRLKVTGAVTGNKRKFIEPGYGASTVFNTISRGLPIFSDYHENNYYGSTWLFTPGRNNIENPRMEVEQGRILRDYQEMLSRLAVDYKLPLDINYNVTAGYRKIDHFSKNFVPQMYTIHPKTGDVKPFNTSAPRVKDWDAYHYQLTMSHRLTWERLLDKKHLVHIMFGQDYQINRNRNFQAYNWGFYTNDLQELDALKDQTNAEATGTSNRDRLNSFYNRLAYTFKDKYLFESTFRYDGSSRFKKSNQWTFYPSVLLGWRIDQEDFFNVRHIDGLKLRGSIGKMGNQAVPMYSYKSTVNISTDYNYSFGGEAAGGAAVSQIIDDEIRWESTTAYNIGIDLIAFNNKLSVTGEYFYKRTKDILRTISIPSHIGGLSGPSTNIGVVDNKGYELIVSYQDKIGDFRYGVNGNISYVKNEIVDLQGEMRISGNTVLKEGYPINSYYLYQANGYFQSKDEIRDAQAVYGTKNKLRPGYLKYVNQNDDYLINQDDKIAVGNPIPKYTYAFGVNLGYKDFTLEAQFQGVQGVDVYPTGNIVFPFQNGAGATMDWATDSWTPDNRNSKYPLLTTYTDAGENFIPSTHWLRDASYLRLKNIQLSYNFPKIITDKMNLSRMMIYISGQNLLTISDFKLWDPEISSTINHLSEYPSLKTISCGINISF